MLALLTVCIQCFNQSDVVKCNTIAYNIINIKCNGMVLYTTNDMSEQSG